MQELKKSHIVPFIFHHILEEHARSQPHRLVLRWLENEPEEMREKTWLLANCMKALLSLFSCRGIEGGEEELGEVGHVWWWTRSKEQNNPQNSQ